MESNLERYSEDYTQFFHVTGISQIQIYDTFTSENIQTFQEAKSLSRKYTSIALYTQSPKKKSKGEDSSSTTKKFVALGTDKGSVVIWDIVAGQLLENWDGKNKIHQKSVSGVVFGSSVLYSCSRDGSIAEWQVSTGKVNHTWVGDKQGELACIAINPEQTVLATASTTIKLWDLSSRKVLAKLAGHTSPVSSMQFSIDGLYLLTAAADRYINLWSTEASKSEQAPARVFSCDSIPKAIQWNRHQSPEDLTQYDFLAVLQSDVVNIWSVNPKKEKKKGHIAGTIKIEGADKTNTLVFGDFSSDNEVILTTDSFGKYQSYRTPYIEVKDEQMVIKKETILKKQEPPVPEQARKKEGGDNKRKAPHVEHVVGQVDMPFEATASTQTNGKRSKIVDVPALTESEKKAFQQEIKGTGTMLSALTQAVHTNDQELFKKILQVIEDRWVTSTISKFPKDKVLTLVDRLVYLLRFQPSIGPIAIKWLKIIFEEHLLYLLEQPDVLQKLSPLYAIIDSRLAMFKRVSTLSGKLDLLLKQASTMRQKKKVFEDKAQFVFKENEVEEESGDESDDERSSSSNEQNGEGYEDEEPDTILEGDEFDDDELLNGGEDVDDSDEDDN
eukprot:TRINITY_DN7982_c0_g1_i1.p1 TRINITY_DN7982_c0_g1~~TRINITY_DN7982_c0_g1_i1.p1  ORF type:complete len:613 (+),score=150.10 TRINITY_DN7982_c0_g1_i1:158-1996(+)